MYQTILKADLDRLGANWTEHQHTSIVADFGEDESSRRSALSHLSIIDLSPLPRSGLKGTDISGCADLQRCDVGQTSNRAYPQHDGSMIVRLGPGELLSLCDPCEPAGYAPFAIENPDHRCHLVNRQSSHYWFAVTGSFAAEMFAKICAVDLSADRFSELSVAQTSVARTNAIVIRNHSFAVPCYYLLGDISTIRYMWRCLADAMAEFDGRPLGLSALRAGP